MDVEKNLLLTIYYFFWSNFLIDNNWNLCLVCLSRSRQIIWECVSYRIFKIPVLLIFILYRKNEDLAGFGLRIVLMACALLLGVLTVANLYTWSRLLRTVFFSQRIHLQRSIAKLETLKSEGFLQTLRQEVSNSNFLEM